MYILKYRFIRNCAEKLKLVEQFNEIKNVDSEFNLTKSKCPIFYSTGVYLDKWRF